MDKHRKIIKESHERSKEYGVDKSDVFSKKILDDKYLRKLFSKNDSLLNISDEFINYLFYSLKDSGFIIILTDSEGCILRIKGDDNITAEARKLNMVEGAYMDEKSIGTNAMGTALSNDRPIQVTAEEHFISAFHRWTCSAAPIHHQNKIIGTLNLTGFKDKVHPHTLSLVLAAVRAIENKLESNEIAQKLFDAQQFAFSMMNHLSFGVFAIDLNDDVQWVNDTACRILNIKRSKLIQMPFGDLLSDWNRIKRVLLHDLKFEDEELSFKDAQIQQTFHFNAYTIRADKSDILGFLVTFRSMKRTMNMLKKVSGMQARYTFDNIQAASHRMLDVISYGKKISKNDSSVLIMGESGTGKEIIAQSIHNASERVNNPFVAVNCGAISSSLIESELFGYEEGAFTGASKGGRPGKFEMADGGTLFLDEIGEMPASMQVKLLRALQEGAVTRVGGQSEIKIDVRIISATNKNLFKEVDQGNFREDLFYRLNVLKIELPPLRNREDDVIVLARHFLIEKAQKLDKPVPELNEEVINDMHNYSWPGNVRELENFMEKYVVLDGKITVEKNNGDTEENKQKIKSTSGFYPRPLAEFEKEALIKTLAEVNGNVSKASKILKIGRNTLYEKLRKYKIHLNYFK